MKNVKSNSDPLASWLPSTAQRMSNHRMRPASSAT
jgi:hypothetical protein